jgi:diphthamide synthase (EF-2-diphthine--ammonia ligase)
MTVIAIKLQAESINILMMQVYMPTSENEDDEVEELYDISEGIVEEDGKGDTNTIVMGTGIALLETNHIGTLLDHMTWEEESQRSNAY